MAGLRAAAVADGSLCCCPTCRLALLLATTAEQAQSVLPAPQPAIQEAQATVQQLCSAIARHLHASGAAPGLSMQQAEAVAQAQALALRPCASLACKSLEGGSEAAQRGNKCTGCHTVGAWGSSSKPGAVKGVCVVPDCLGDWPLLPPCCTPQVRYCSTACAKQGWRHGGHKAACPLLHALAADAEV